MTDTISTPVAGGAHKRHDEQDRASFYLTGRRMDTHLGNVEGLGLRSVQFAPYRHLTDLRYDFPLILADGSDVHGTLVSLSGMVDDLLRAVAVGEDADRIRHHAMILEREIRARADQGSARLSEVWAESVRAITEGTADDEVADSLTRLSAARQVDGELVGCVRDTARQVVGHLWQLVQRARMGQLGDRIAHLREELQDILDAETANSPAGLAADKLAGSLGPVFGSELDATALSALLTDNRPVFALPDSRRDRVRRLLDVLVHQRFVPVDGDGADRPDLYDFVYTDVSDAIDAYHERFAETTELAKALVIAEMEADGRYREDTHDALFEKWNVADLDAETLELFPEYLVRVDAEELSAEDSVALLEALSAGIPLKALVQVNDLLRGSSSAGRAVQSGLSAGKLATAALASGDAFVMQCASAALFHARDRIVAGSSSPGAALFVVYSGEGQWLGDLPHYLAAAAALESRVFPSFAYDPAAGDTWAERFTLACNPQPDRDWPVHPVTYQDQALQSVTLDVPFTAADFWACDARLVPHLALAADDGSDGQVVAFADHLASNPGAWADELPYLLMISQDDHLHRVLVDRPLVHMTLRSVEQWHRLQELGGIHNSHVDRELARQREEFEEEKARLEAAIAAAPGAGTPVAGSPAASAAAPAANAVPEAAPEDVDDLDEPQAHDPYLPWIETPRCSTCNECTTINDRMFAYNENRQAYIADPDAGSYAELVLAAESCQVAIIHPGKPRNPAEPGLDELTKRAEAFA
ncbi:MAG: hypothetical protein U0R78_08185 [Nocardioidaceae bacterium]